ncbi:TPA: glycosyltransferase [Streptococcus suis]|nr:glycosyltransferase [Streptococcus suis]HEM3717240.1 glycosyltransferase [Streptococcus suis]
MEKVAVSVICTSYNYEQYISKALNSILNQKTDFIFEVIVVDDCSTDSSRTILEKFREQYPNYIRLFFNEKNKGLTRTWIDICKEARGKYIARCDADDYWIDEYKLQKQFDLLESDEALLWSNTSFNIVDENDQVLAEDVFRNGPIAYANTYEKMLATKGMTLTSSWMVDTKLMQAVNQVIDPDSVDDGFPMQLEFFQKTKLAFVDDVCVAYRMTSNSDSRPVSEEKMLHRINGLLKTQLEYLAKYPHENMAEIANILVRHDAKQEERIYYLSKQISELTSGAVPYEYRSEKVTVYFEHPKNGFNQEDLLQVPISSKDKISICLPGDCRKIRIDLSEKPSFYSKVQLVSDSSKTEIIPSFTNGISLGHSFIFQDTDPQIIYDIPEFFGKNLILEYEMYEIDDIYSEDFGMKVLGREVLDLKQKQARAESLEIENIQLKNLIENQQKDLISITNQYNSVISSRRWTIPTKIINFFRRNK